MRVAIIGSRGITALPEGFELPEGTTQIISGGARGVDTLARKVARAHGLPLLEIRPDYARYGRVAPLRRNDEIIAAADLVIAVWDGRSPGTAYVIRRCREVGKACRVIKAVSSNQERL